MLPCFVYNRLDTCSAGEEGFENQREHSDYGNLTRHDDNKETLIWKKSMKSNESCFVGLCIHACSIRQHHHQSSIPMHVHIQYIILYPIYFATHSRSQIRENAYV